MPCLSNFESWNCILTWFLLSASVFVNEVEEGGSNILLLDLFICCLSNLTIVRFLLLAFKLWFTLNHLSWFSSSGDIVLILWRRPEVRTPIIPVSFHYTKVTFVSLCIRDSQHRWTWDVTTDSPLTRLAMGQAITKVSCFQKDGGMLTLTYYSGVVNAKERHSGVAVVHRCFPDGGNSILNISSWEPSWVRLQDY